MVAVPFPCFQIPSISQRQIKNDSTARKKSVRNKTNNNLKVAGTCKHIRARKPINLLTYQMVMLSAKVGKVYVKQRKVKNRQKFCSHHKAL
jgi:hypothetical protein